MNEANTSGWVVVPQNDINKPERIYKDGTGFQFMISPSDIPVAFRVLLVPKDQPKDIVVEFKYLSSHEETKTVHHQDGVRAEVGKISSKIYKLLLDIATIEKKANSNKFEFDVAMPVLAHSVEAFEHEGSLKSGNADAIKRVINIRNNLFHGLPTATG
ncbi:hypothetical protein ACUNTK_005114 [Pseudomonas aeruginosa]